MSEFYIKCWNCKKPVTLEARRENDGNCTNCQSELDLECYLESADDIQNALLAERVILLQEIEQLKAYRAITEQAIGVIHLNIKEASYSSALGELENCITELNKLEGQG